MIDLNDYKIDEAKEEEGVWEDIGENSRVKVARMSSKKYTEELDRILKPHRRSLRRGTLNESIIETAMIRAMSKHILLDWEGLTIKGQPIEYTPGNCHKVLTEFPEFRDQVTEIATSFDLFKAEEEAEAEKN